MLIILHVHKLIRFHSNRCLWPLSHLINVPPGPHNLSDMILSTIMSDGSAPMPMGGVGMAAANAEFGGVDPNMDPDLAMVRLHPSMASRYTLSSVPKTPIVDMHLIVLIIIQFGSAADEWKEKNPIFFFQRHFLIRFRCVTRKRSIIYFSI